MNGEDDTGRHKVAMGAVPGSISKNPSKNENYQSMIPNKAYI